MRNSGSKNHSLTVEEYQNINSIIHRMSAGSKLLLLLVYIISVTSVNNYKAFELFVMILFPVIAYQFAFIPVSAGLYKVRFLLPFICIIGIFNPFFDRKVVFILGNLSITGGWLSCVCLLEKAIFCLLATLLFILTTKIEDISRALIKVHLSKKLISLMAMTYRYVFVLIDEINEMKTYYSLRSPKAKGIYFKHAGSFLGQLLLRTMDRGQAIYESMELRGYNGELYYVESKLFTKYSWFIAMLGIVMIISVRIFMVGL